MVSARTAEQWSLTFEERVVKKLTALLLAVRLRSAYNLSAPAELAHGALIVSVCQVMRSSWSERPLALLTNHRKLAADCFGVFDTATFSSPYTSDSSEPETSVHTYYLLAAVKTHAAFTC